MKTKLKKPVMVRVGALRPHPKNDFKDIVGERWDAFLKAIKLDGVLHPIYINQKYEVLSGAQRVRACRSLGIKTVPAVVLPPMTPQEERYFIIDMNMGRGLSSEDLSKYLLERYAEEFEIIENNYLSNGNWKSAEKKKAIEKIVRSGVIKSGQVKYIAKKRAIARIATESEHSMDMLPAASVRAVTAAKAKATALKQKARDVCDQHNAQVDIIAKHIKPAFAKVSKARIVSDSLSGKIFIANQSMTIRANKKRGSA